MVKAGGVISLATTRWCYSRRACNCGSYQPFSKGTQVYKLKE